jgi:hypothetical protein
MGMESGSRGPEEGPELGANAGEALEAQCLADILDGVQPGSDLISLVAQKEPDGEPRDLGDGLQKRSFNCARCAIYGSVISDEAAKIVSVRNPRPVCPVVRSFTDMPNVVDIRSVRKT